MFFDAVWKKKMFENKWRQTEYVSAFRTSRVLKRVSLTKLRKFPQPLAVPIKELVIYTQAAAGRLHS